MNELIAADQTPDSQLELNKVFQKALAFLQNFTIESDSDLGTIILNILRTNLLEVYSLERNKNLEFVIRAYAMLSFYAFKLLKLPGINIISNF